jgi:hypothetical protein
MIRNLGILKADNLKIIKELIMTKENKSIIINKKIIVIFKKIDKDRKKDK